MLISVALYDWLYKNMRNKNRARLGRCWIVVEKHAGEIRKWTSLRKTRNKKKEIHKHV